LLQCDLRNVKFAEVRLRNTLLNGANVSGATFKLCDVDGADFEGCNMQAALTPVMGKSLDKA